MRNKKTRSLPTEPLTIPFPQNRGGPRTAEGKAVSRHNAMTHGLTAQTLLPEILQPGRVEALRALLKENPRTVLTDALLDEIARHIARLEVAEKAEEAVLREGARVAVYRTAAAGGLDLSDADSLFCAAVTTPALELQMRFRRSHERGLNSALRTLAFLGNVLSSAAPQSESEAPEFEEPRFVTESACEAFLKQRLFADSWRCPRCNGPNGHWLASRKTWECAKCKKQSGLRAGTLFERSALPLAKWFHATQLLVQHPEIGIPTLAAKLGIDRDKTVRTTAAKIRAALADETGREKLVGLDEVFRQPKPT